MSASTTADMLLPVLREILKEIRGLRADLRAKETNR